MRNSHTETEVDLVLDLYFRDHRRPTPLARIAEVSGLVNENAVNCLLWRVCTGYGGNVAECMRRTYTPHPGRASRAGRWWWPREDAMLRNALEGDGQLRQPPCDIAYIAAVLARPCAEVEERWAALKRDPLDREGFGLGKA